MLKELTKDGTNGQLRALDVVDESGEDCAGGVAMEEADGAAEDGLVEMIAQVGDGSEASVVDEVRAELVADAFDER